MSAAPPSSFVRDGDVLGALLHSLSQPLTSLRCFLELSLDEAAEEDRTALGLALQQTERIIGIIELMRAYLDAGQAGMEAHHIPLEHGLRKLVDDLASAAVLRGIDLRLEGTSSARVCLPESRLRLALQYLLSPLLDAVTPGTCVVLCLEEGLAGSALRTVVVGGAHTPGQASPLDTVERAKVAIAQRLLETAGMRLTIEEGDHLGFVLWIPHLSAASSAIL